MDAIKSIYDNLGFVVVNFELGCEQKDGRWKKQFRFPKGYQQKTVSDQFGIHNAYGILTGKKSGITVVDIDDPDIQSAGALMDEMDGCSLVVQTRRGYHYYYKYTPSLKSITNEEHKIDIRNDGAIILCPPTESVLNPDGDIVAEYSFLNKSFQTIGLVEMPAHVQDFLMNMNKFKSTVKNDSTEEKAPKETHIALKIISHLPTKYLDTYSDWLDIGIILFNEGLKCADWDRISSRSTKYSPKACKEKWETFSNDIANKKTIATLWKMLKDENLQAFKTLMKERQDFWKLIQIVNHKDIAKYFYNLNPDSYLWNEVLGWYSLQRFNIWKHNDKSQPSGLKRHIADTMQFLCQETQDAEISTYKVNVESTTDEDIRAKLIKTHFEKMRIINSAYKVFGSSEFCNGVIAFLPSFYENDQLENLMDMNRTIFAFNDKCYDLTTLEFRDITPLDFVSTTTGYDVPIGRNKDVETRIRKFISTIFECKETSAYLLFVLASCLLGQNRWEELYILTGTGGNGKGVISELLKSVFGTYYYSVDISLFTKVNDRKDQPAPALVEARSKRIMMSTEPEKDDKLQVALLKKISGNDVIEARTLHCKNIVKYVPQFKLLLQMNTIPQLSGIDGGVQRRFRIIDFPFKFVSEPKPNSNERLADPDVKLKLCSSEEWRNEFLYILIDAYSKIRDLKALIPPASVKKSTGDYVDDNNPLKSWLTKFYTVTGLDTDFITARELKTDYLNDTGIEKIPDVTFKQMLVFNNIASKRMKYGVVYTGLKRIIEELSSQQE
jgi:P4 family phage/plasmid primase-like protien